ncbi:MAG: 4-hydroxythreonine-4-phosphate dehydrogenase PdxA [Treponemataceae bacterium]|nr:MAG: 4-hydroxythreonine-4-phosphate dehydrogenase PdxA [Treponemataceae bacterium]
MNKPLIGIPLGDPAGIGPEIVAKALADPAVTAAARCVVVGDENVVKQAIAITKAALTIKVLDSGDPTDGDYRPGVLNLVAINNIDSAKFTFGAVSGMCGKAAYDYIERSIALAMARKIDAVATTPINKEALKAGGVNFIGHTEIFGALTKTADPLTMFEVHGMRVFFLTRHVSLRRACELVSTERIVDYVKRCTDVLLKLGVTGGTMAIAGLNPHSGEHGLFGDEEMEAVFPAVEELKAAGYDVAGPIGADSVFHQALQGRYNSVLSLYHDQGHIATKTLDFDRTIAITGGMPILRTSVDHGTAFDIAGRGIAGAVSMVEAIVIAAKYVPAFSGIK